MSFVANAGLRRDVKILGLVSAGHFLSHFYAICLPPVFLFMKDDLGVSFAALGLVMGVRSFVSGAMQIPAGMLVDRIGAKPVLLGGMTLMAGATALVAVAPDYWSLMLLGIVMSLGNSVFHPTDYAILNASVTRSWVGRAFSLHGFAGQLGTAVAPAIVLALAHYSDWRTAQAVIGIAGFVVMAGLALEWRNMHDDAIPQRRKKQDAAAPNHWAILLSAPMLVMSTFFTATSLQSGGMQSFFVVGLTALHGTPAATAGSALSAYLLAIAVGVLGGGVLADITKRHDITSAVAFLVSAALLALVVWLPLDNIGLLAVMTVSGLMQGAVRPARDMMVRALVPAGAMGKAFGIVSSGQAVGGAIAPVLFGWIVDIGRPDWVFYLMIFFTLLCVLASFAPKALRTVEVV